MRQRRNGNDSYGRKRPRRGSVTLAATLRHRRPTDQSLRRTDLNLTATYVNGDTATRPPTTPVDTVSSGTHSDGSASARPSGNFDSHTGSRPDTSSDSHSDSQSDNSVNDYRVTFIHYSNQTVSRFYDRLTVTNSRTFHAAVSHKLSRVTLSRSLLNTISQLN